MMWVGLCLGCSVEGRNVVNSGWRLIGEGLNYLGYRWSCGLFCYWVSKPQKLTDALQGDGEGDCVGF
jgi:hypothetical protein